MGDRSRFALMSKLISRKFPNRELKIADVAAGKGLMQSALKGLGYNRVTSWDKRKKNAGGRPSFKYGHINYRTFDPSYDLIIGMHPDGATDHIIDYAVMHRKPFVVCPCCVIPSSDLSFSGKDYHSWMKHLNSKAERSGMRIENIQLPMAGRNIVIVGTPYKTQRTNP